MQRTVLQATFVLITAWLPCAAIASDSVWQGSFIAKSEDGGMFSPCRSGKRYTTRDATAAREAAGLYREVAPRAGRPVFLEFVGERESEEGLRIERVLRMAASGPGCAESPQGFLLRAYGASPLWRLDLSPETLLFQRAASPPVTWPSQPFSLRAGTRELAARGEGGDIRVIIVPGRCVDQLAGAVFSLRAEVLFEGRTYEGCAYDGELNNEKAPR